MKGQSRPDLLQNTGIRVILGTPLGPGGVPPPPPTVGSRSNTSLTQVCGWICNILTAGHCGP